MNQQSKIQESTETTYVLLRDCPIEVHNKVIEYRGQLRLEGRKLTIPEAFYEFIRTAKI